MGRENLDPSVCLTLDCMSFTSRGYIMLAAHTLLQWEIIRRSFGLGIETEPSHSSGIRDGQKARLICHCLSTHQNMLTGTRLDNTVVFMDLELVGCQIMSYLRCLDLSCFVSCSNNNSVTSLRSSWGEFRSP